MEIILRISDYVSCWAAGVRRFRCQGRIFNHDVALIVHPAVAQVEFIPGAVIVLVNAVNLIQVVHAGVHVPDVNTATRRIDRGFRD